MSLIVDIEKRLGDFNLKIKFGTNEKVTALLGASGSGKSLTLKCIAGVLTPDKGRIVLNGRVLFDSEKHISVKVQDRHVGYFFQDYALFPTMNVKSNILMGMKRFSKEYDRNSKLLEVCRLFDIENLLEHYPNQLSGGQKQRVALARILVNDPEIILFDEPFSALDEFLRTRLQMETKEILEKFNKEAILVTHNRDEAYMLTKQTVLIDHGEVVENNLTSELFKNPKYLKTAILTGCKNYAKCEVRDNEIIVPEWGLSFKNIKHVDNEIKYVGIRAHRFSENENENRNEIIVQDVIAQPFENLVRFRFKNQTTSSELVYWLTSKENPNISDTKKLGFKNSDILLLK